ncbi:rRNA accumulation- protein [Collariella sp. IMI 366227]|nr:rRNA accumulation- protein [Collariella sp. IMI 366227]
MASTSAPSPATCQTNFEQSVAITLHLWPALTLAVQNNWGGPDSSDKRDWFAGAIVDLFPDEDVEAVLLQVMLDEFEVNVDDDSAFEVAEQVVRLRGEGREEPEVDEDGFTTVVSRKKR